MQWKITNAALALTLLWSAPTMAELYRYVDDKGVTVLDSRVPPKFISRGYEVLDAHGRVKLVVPAAPTAAEREARRAALEEQAQRDAADATLLITRATRAEGSLIRPHNWLRSTSSEGRSASR